jgi:hypothetical protein
MNSYSASYAQPADSLPYSFAKLLVLPLFVGTFLDITITQFIGVQHCSFKDAETKCIIAGQTLSAPVREFTRVLVQLLVILALYYLTYTYAPTYMATGTMGILGLSSFIFTQNNLYEDFRRMINSILFKIKHN